jgi:hypothetical protein
MADENRVRPIEQSLLLGPPNVRLTMAYGISLSSNCLHAKCR